MVRVSKILALMVLPVMLWAQTAPSGYTPNFGFRKWAQGANPGADSLNANWTDIDTKIFTGKRGAIWPAATSTHDLGTTSLRWDSSFVNYYIGTSLTVSGGISGAAITGTSLNLGSGTIISGRITNTSTGNMAARFAKEQYGVAILYNVPGVMYNLYYNGGYKFDGASGYGGVNYFDHTTGGWVWNSTTASGATDGAATLTGNLMTLSQAGALNVSGNITTTAGAVIAQEATNPLYQLNKTDATARIWNLQYNSGALRFTDATATVDALTLADVTGAATFASTIGGSLIADTSSFTTTATRKAVFVSGITTTDKFAVSHRNASGDETLPVAGDQLSYYVRTDSLIVLRAAGTTSGQKFSYIRIR